MASGARTRKSSPKARKRAAKSAKRKSAARSAKRGAAATRKRAATRGTSAAARKRKRAATSAKRKSIAGTRTRKTSPRRSVRLGFAMALAADPVVEKLKQLIAAKKIIFDADRHRKSLLGLSTGTNATRKLQSLVLKLSELAVQQIRISSVVRTGGGSHHVTGRAVDIGNEEIADTLLPLVATDVQVAALQIDELIFDATKAGETNPNKWNYDRGVKHNYGAATLNQHRNHIHFAVKA
jgi:hypothetical protein